MRSDTNTHELISPPTFSSDHSNTLHTDGTSEKKTSRLFRRSRSPSVNSTASRTSDKSKSDSPKSKRLSERLHLKRSEPSSASVPDNLPEITLSQEDQAEDRGVIESQWEKRATMLAKKNESTRSRPTTPGASTVDLPGAFNKMGVSDSVSKDKGVVSTKYVDDNIQEVRRISSSPGLCANRGCGDVFVGHGIVPIN